MRRTVCPTHCFFRICYFPRSTFTLSMSRVSFGISFLEGSLEGLVIAWLGCYGKHEVIWGPLQCCDTCGMAVYTGGSISPTDGSTTDVDAGSVCLCRYYLFTHTQVTENALQRWEAVCGWGPAKWLRLFPVFRKHGFAQWLRVLQAELYKWLLQQIQLSCL